MQPLGWQQNARRRSRRRSSCCIKRRWWRQEPTISCSVPQGMLQRGLARTSRSNRTPGGQAARASGPCSGGWAFGV